MQVNDWIVELAARAMFVNRDEYDDRNLNAHPAFEHDREYWEGQARAALTAALGAMWRPISEAPKDGTRILVWSPAWHAPCSACWYGSDWRQAYDLPAFAHQPTHFMLLSSPPAQEEG